MEPTGGRETSQTPSSCRRTCTPGSWSTGLPGRGRVEGHGRPVPRGRVGVPTPVVATDSCGVRTPVVGQGPKSGTGAQQWHRGPAVAPVGERRRDRTEGAETVEGDRRRSHDDLDPHPRPLPPPRGHTSTPPSASGPREPGQGRKDRAPSGLRTHSVPGEGDIPYSGRPRTQPRSWKKPLKIDGLTQSLSHLPSSPLKPKQA